jgi:hypothetical protein
VNLVQGDTYPPLIIDTNADVTGATAVATIRRKHQPIASAVTKTMTLTDPTNGVLQYEWVAGDTDQPGTFLVRAVVTFGTGEVQTFPQDSDLELTIRRRLNA